MDNIFRQALITSGLTLGSGIVLFIIKSLVGKTVELRAEFIDLKTKISFDLTYYNHRIHNPLKYDDWALDRTFEHAHEASNELRRAAVSLYVFSERHSNFIMRILVGLPKAKKINKVKGDLIGLSNSLIYGEEETGANLNKENKERIKSVRKTLDIKDTNY